MSNTTFYIHSAHATGTLLRGAYMPMSQHSGPIEMTTRANRCNLNDDNYCNSTDNRFSKNRIISNSRLDSSEQEMVPYYPRQFATSIAILAPFADNFVSGQICRLLDKTMDCQCRLIFDVNSTLEDDRACRDLWNWAECLLILGHQQAVSPKNFEKICHYAHCGGGLVYLGNVCDDPNEQLKLTGAYSRGSHAWQGEAQIDGIQRSDQNNLLEGVESFTSATRLVRNSAPSRDCQILLRGKIPGSLEPVAWTRKFGDGKLFYSNLGEETDWLDENWLKLVSHAIKWTSARR